MKKIMLLMLAIAVSAVAMAENVTSEQALEQALQFLQQREATGTTGRKAPVKPAELSTPLLVSGLYVFNVADGDGFVVIANDNRSIPVLAYSDSGSIDIDHMPANMRAWLQGYADQIAWLKGQEAQSTSAQNARSRTPQRVGTHSTNNISPLLSCTWNQNSPYNNSCPNGCPTGCVATAMAQVMYYTERKAGSATTTTTTDIPSYTSATYGFAMSAIPAGSTLNWSNMIDNYSAGYTSVQATAVATLMNYCGTALKMDYGPYSSGAHTFNVASALKNYFGYSETTQYASRSFYTYANWVDLLYNELNQGRPVVYGGSSVDNGHTFVCDGYKYESGTDFFHINWGWGGQSDGYFALTALDPLTQGIGGSASASAYNFCQDAIVGIQKTGQTDNVLANASNVNMRLNSIELSRTSISLGESVNITVNVTNNSTDAYDGDIVFTVGGAIAYGANVNVPANKTQDCVISFTPRYTGTAQIMPLIPNGQGEYYTHDDKIVALLTVTDAKPTGLAASNITCSSADISWASNGEVTSWNLRYKPITTTTHTFDSPDSDWEAIYFGGNNSTWSRQANGGIDNSPCYASPSYADGADKTPFTGLSYPTPIGMGGSFSFYAWGANEHFSVYISNNGKDWQSVNGETVATSVPTKYTVDLSGYSGIAYLAIIHLNSSGHTSESYLYIDNVTFTVPGEWTSVEGISTNPYTLTGLNRLTSYEVQVQAILDGATSNWSTTLAFTTQDNTLTLSDSEISAAATNADLIAVWNSIEADVTLDGRTLWKDGLWNTLCLPFEATLEGSLAGATLMELDTEGTYDTDKKTGLADDGTLYLYFKTAESITAGKPYIIKWAEDNENPTIVNPTFSSVTLNSTPPAPVAFTGGQFVGNYSPVVFTTGDQSKLYLGAGNQLYWPNANMSVGAFRAYFQLSIPAGVRTFRLSFDGDGATAIATTGTAGSADEADVWYDLMGRKLDVGTFTTNGRPAQPGIYIKRAAGGRSQGKYGRKIVVK